MNKGKKYIFDRLDGFCFFFFLVLSETQVSNSQVLHIVTRVLETRNSTIFT